MTNRLPIDIAPDLRVSIGRATVRLTPQMGLVLAQSLARVAARQLVREETDRARAASPRAATTPVRKVPGR